MFAPKPQCMSFKLIFAGAISGLALSAGLEWVRGSLGSACLLGVLVLLSVSYLTAPPEVRQTRAILVSFLSGLSVLVCLTQLSPRVPADSKGLKTFEAVLLGYTAVHSLTEYAFLQAQADEEDRRELFTRLTGFFTRYDSLRAPSPQTGFRAFSGTGFKVVNGS